MKTFVLKTTNAYNEEAIIDGLVVAFEGSRYPVDLDFLVYELVGTDEEKLHRVAEIVLG